MSTTAPAPLAGRTPAPLPTESGNKLIPLPGEALLAYDPDLADPRMDRTIRIAALVVTLAAALLGAWVGSRVLENIGRPWPGFILLPDARVGHFGMLPLRLQRAAAGLRHRDQLLAVDGRALTSPAILRAAVEGAPVGTPITYRVARVGGLVTDVVVPTTTLTTADFVEACLPFLVTAFVGLVLGLVPVLSRPELTAARLFFCIVNVGLSVDVAFRIVASWGVYAYPRIGWLTTGIWLGAFVHLTLLSPTRRNPLRSFPIPTLVACYGCGVAAALLNWSLDRSVGLNIMLYGGGIIWPLNIGLTILRSNDARLRQQARIMAIGFAPVFLDGAVWAAVDAGLLPVGVPPIAYFLPLWLFASTLAWAIIDHDLFEVDAMVRRTTALGLLATLGIVLFVGLFALLHLWLDAALAWATAGVSMVLLLTMAPVVAPVRHRLEAAIERRLLPRQRRAREAVHAASRELAHLRDERELVETLRDVIARAMAGATVRLVVADEAGAAFTERGLSPGEPLVTLAPDDPLHRLTSRGSSVRFDRLEARRRGGTDPVVRRAAMLAASVLVPLRAKAPVAAALLVGQRGDGRPYTRDDEILLETLAAQAAAALDNARAWDTVRALERRLQAENVYLREEVTLALDVEGIVGRSPALRAVLAQVDQVAPSDATVLVMGETGTGKELVVRALHARSRRAERTLVKVACAALPESLLESEFFGHERGAFTGATARKPGRFEVADGGTLFLDDVDTLPLGVQAKLLRAVQEGEMQRLGSNEIRKVDVRVVAATNRNLLAEVRAGRFREDLYYRLNVVPIHLPPLRERREDIAALVEHFIARDGPELGKTVSAISAAAMAALEAWHWPGNVRELRNVIQRALVLSNGDVLRLPGPLDAADEAAAPSNGHAGPLLADQVRDLKMQLICAALAASGGNQRIAAERLGLHRQSLARMMRDLGLGANTTAGVSYGGN